jgi:hypothetical protein
MSRIHRCCIALACILALPALAGQDGKNLFYIINYTILHVNAELEINGVPVTRTDKDSAYCVTGTADAGRWIMPGANIITVTVKPPERAIPPEDRRSIEITVSTAVRGQMSDEGVKIATLSVPEKEGDTSLASIKQEFKKDLRFTPASPPPSELWSKSKPEKLDNAARAEILRLVKDYHAAYVKKDRDKLYDMLLFATLEAARNRYFTADEAIAMLKSGLAEMMSDRNFVMEPLQADRLVMKPIAGGRIIWVTDAKNEAPVRTKRMKDGGYVEYPVYAARIDGKWVLVR